MKKLLLGGVVTVVLFAGVGLTYFLMQGQENKVSTSGSPTVQDFFAAQDDSPCSDQSISEFEKTEQYRDEERLLVYKGIATCFRVQSNFDKSIEYLAVAKSIAIEIGQTEEADEIQLQIDSDTDTKADIQKSEEALNDPSLVGEGGGTL